MDSFDSIWLPTYRHLITSNVLKRMKKKQDSFDIEYTIYFALCAHNKSISKLQLILGEKLQKKKTKEKTVLF